MKLGKIIQEIRKVKNFTQKALAEAIGLKSLTISKIENNRQNVSQETVCKIANALSIPSSYLYILADGEEDSLLNQFQIEIRNKLGIT